MRCHCAMPPAACHRVPPRAAEPPCAAKAPPSAAERCHRAMPPPACHRVPPRPPSSTVRCKASPSATIRATARRRVLPSAAECQMPPTDLSTTTRQRVARCIRSATACLHKAARHRLPLRGTARATGGCRASLRAMESRVECHRVPPIAIKCHQVHTLRATECHRAVSLRAAACQRVPPRTAKRHLQPSGTEWHRGLRAT